MKRRREFRISQTRILEWVFTSYPRDSSHFRDQTPCPVSHALAGRFFSTESPGKPFYIEKVVGKGQGERSPEAKGEMRFKK